MRRPVLIALTVVGSITVVMGGVGTFAALTDAARTGTNFVETGALPAAADIRLGPDQNCALADLSDDLTTALHTVSLLPSPTDSAHDEGVLCIKNVGVAPVTIRIGVVDLVDVETGCTGDESDVDTTCHPTEDVPVPRGELSESLRVDVPGRECHRPQPQIISTLTTTLSRLATQPGYLTELDPDVSLCVWVRVTLNASDSTVAQTDSVSWRYVVTAEAL